MKIRKVLISGGREIGGLTSFAKSLSEGFMEIGIPSSILRTKDLLLRWRELRDPTVLKVLSTDAVYLSPICRHSICVAHGFPRVDSQGYFRAIGIIISLKIAQRFSRLIAVSDYVRLHLQAIFNIACHATIHNPVSKLFVGVDKTKDKRRYITFVGRFHKVKNIDKLIEPIRLVLDQWPEYRCVLIGEGELKSKLEEIINGDSRFVLAGPLPPVEVRCYLQKTAVFISGCETEALGISYLEALSQGCNVVMPGSGGGLEIDLDEIGHRIFLIPINLNQLKCVEVLEAALASEISSRYDVKRYSGAEIAKKYISAASSTY